MPYARKQFAVNNKIEYFYDAVGTKQKKKVTNGAVITTTDYAGKYIYQNNVLQMISQPEGYLEPNGQGGYDYGYRLKDHLGNIRLTFVDFDHNGSIALSEITEENNYYPFGLKHKGYNFVVSSNTNAVANKFKYNGIELEESLGLNLYEMPMRQYDPTIGRFTSIDPVTNFTQSTYAAFDNNPIFWADPSGAYSTREWMEDNGVTDDDLITIYKAPDESENQGEESGPPDDITVNKDGVVTSVVKNDKPNRFFDESSAELFFNDSEELDKFQLNNNYSVGDRLYYSVSFLQMYNQILKSGLIYERNLSNSSALGSAGGGLWMYSWFKAAGKGHGSYDFAEGFLVNLIDNPIKNLNSGRRDGYIGYHSDTGYFRFGNEPSIYNLYDAGNYMWGSAMRLSGFSYWEAKFGSQANEYFRDSKADQQAIKNSYK